MEHTLIQPYSTARNQQWPPFLQLPAELRNEIYAYALTALCSLASRSLEENTTKSIINMFDPAASNTSDKIITPTTPPQPTSKGPPYNWAVHKYDGDPTRVFIQHLIEIFVEFEAGTSALWDIIQQHGSGWDAWEVKAMQGLTGNLPGHAMIQIYDEDLEEGFKKSFKMSKTLMIGLATFVDAAEEVVRS